MLVLDSVTLAYDVANRQTVAINRFSLSVAPAERVVLLGPSGCGKTSLLKAVAGFVQPVEGKITLGNRPIDRPGRDRIMVFQAFDQLLPWKSVQANVAFALRAAHRRPRADAARLARAWLAKVGLAPFASAYPHELSGGMQQRAALARALALEPDILLMDEPFAALDGLTRTAMQQELLRLWSSTRMTLLLVTHSIEEAIAIGDRIVILSPRPGEIIAEFAGICHTGCSYAAASELRAAIESTLSA